MPSRLRWIDHEFVYSLSALILAITQCAYAHVALTFPPARYPALDFLDNARTKGPCGVQKPTGKGNPTTLRSGSTFNVTWSLTYPHQGGFRIELLDDKDQSRYALTPENAQFVGQEDQTATQYQVTLPSDFECQNCGIRLLRQAGEWGTYTFWSCADVSIVREPKDVCQGHGESKEGHCQCERLYSGDYCQSKDECWADQDCGINGRCEELKTFSYPKRVCFCKQGWFGPNCNSPSALQKSTIDISQYQKEEFGVDKNKLYWRILKEQREIEVVLQYPGKSWIAIGWRPQNIPGTCANIDRLVSTISAISSSSIDQVPVPSAEPKPTSSEAAPTLPNLPSTTTNGNSTEQPTSSTTGVEIRPDATTAILGTSGGSSIVESTKNRFQTPPPFGNQNATHPPIQPISSGSTEAPIEGPFVSPIVGAGSKLEFTGSPIPFPPPYEPRNASQGARKPEIGDSDVSGELCYGDWRFPPDCNENCDLRVSWAYVEETDEIEFSVEAKAPQSSWTALGFSPSGTMNDADMIVTKSLQNRITVFDMFSIGYGPPAKDPLQNVTVSQVPGTHVNGVLRTSYRRPRKSSDTRDVSFSDTECYYFLLAQGSLNADGSMNKHINKPHVSKRKVCIASCNPSPLGAGGEKYVTCDREFKYPPGCKQPTCDYVANWTYVPQLQEVMFQVSAREIGRWTGIGFSRDGNMTGSDMILGWVYENGTYVTDRFAYGRQQPSIDKQQDVRDIHGRVEDDIQTITFTRKMITNDPEDISLKECLYYLFPVGGGRVLARTSKDFRDKTTALGFHDQTLPKISRDLICICNDDGIPVNITNNRVRRQALDDEPKPAQSSARRVPVIPAGQTSVNISLGAPKLPIFDPKAFEETLLTATSLHPTKTIATTESTTPEEESSEDETTTEPNQHPKSGVVSINSSLTIAPVSSAVVVVTAPSLLSPASVPVVSPAKTVGSGSPVPEPEPTNSTGSPKNLPVLHSEPTLQGNGSSEPEPKPEPHQHDHAHPEPSAESGSDSLHPMDCVDMIIGSAVGLYSRVGDYYSISRSTPKSDNYFGGTQDLIAATGFEENGVTTIAFRRRLNSIDPFDHNITLDTEMFVIWAKGQEYGSYSHSAPSGLDQGDAAIKDFYTPDVLAYHGNKNRGSLLLSFGGKKQASNIPAMPTCRQEFVYPSGCSGESCQYNVTWSKYGGDVEFWIETQLESNHWTGIGFSKDGRMANSDAVIVTVETPGPPEVTDRFISGYEAPTIDKKQNIFNIEASYINGRVKAQFSRPLTTDDSEEDLDLNECLYFLYPYNGGLVNEHRAQKHSATPLRSSEQICLNKCHSGSSGHESTSTENADHAKTPIAKKPPELATPAPVVDRGRKFLIILRIINEQWNEALAVATSPEYEAMSTKVIKVMDSLLRSKFAGFERARVLKFIQGSVVAEVEVSAVGLNSVQLQEAIIPRVNLGQIEGLQIDPEYVRVREIQVGLSQEEIRNYIIIAVACFLVMIATAFAICMIVRTRRRRSKDIKANENVMPYAPYAYLMPTAGVYPMAYQYPIGTMDPKKQSVYPEAPLLLAGAQGYAAAADYSATGSRRLGAHNRQYSNATTATPVNGNGNGKTPSPGSDKHSGNGARTMERHKNGNGDQAYGQQGPRGQRDPSPYVQYPNDYSFYTLGGSHRPPPNFQSLPRPMQPAAPRYYRPY